MAIPETLRELQVALGARFETEAGVETVAAYGEPEREREALRGACGLLDRTARGKLRVTGSERVGFVHGLVTNEVNKLSDGRATYAALLTPKGHMVGDARILKRRDELLLDTEPAALAEMLAFLDRHLISEDAALADVTAGFALLSLLGPRSADVAAALGAPVPREDHQLVEWPERQTVLVGAWLGRVPGIDLFVPAPAAAALAQAALERGGALGLAPVGERAFEILRVEEGVPRFGRDMTGETIPLEASLERAISYDKGCYVGQEVIARATFRGAVKRKLTGFELPDGPLPPGTALFQAAGDSKAAGELTTVVESPAFGAIALGYARREHLAEGTRLVTAEGRAARVRPLPWPQGK